MPKRFVKHIDGRLRRDFTGFRATDTISDGKDAALVIAQYRILVQWPLLVQAAVADACGFQIVCRCGCAHSTASSLIWLSGSRFTRASARASTAFRCENAINIPSIAKLVIRLKPPWLTKGKVIPVMGSARRMPPMLTSA